MSVRNSQFRIEQLVVHTATTILTQLFLDIATTNRAIQTQSPKKMCEVLGFFSSMLTAAQNNENSNNGAAVVAVAGEGRQRQRRLGAVAPLSVTLRASETERDFQPHSQELMFAMEFESKESVRREISKLPIPPPKSSAFAAQEYVSPSPSSSSAMAPQHSSDGSSKSPETEREMYSTTPNSCTSDPSEEWDVLTMYDFKVSYNVRGTFLGSGTYGSVYATLDYQRSQFVAVKVMHAAF